MIIYFSLVLGKFAKFLEYLAFFPIDHLRADELKKPLLYTKLSYVTPCIVVTKEFNTSLTKYSSKTF